MSFSEVVAVVEEAPKRTRLMSRIAGAAHATLNHGRRITRANADVTKLLWKQRRGLSLVRMAVWAPMVGTPFLMSWSTGQVVAGVAQNVPLASLAGDIAVLAGALSVAGALPLVLKVLDRLVEHWAFTHVQQEQVLKVPDLDPVTYSDPNLKDKIQQVQERAVWRIMAFAQSQLLLGRATALAAIASVMLARYNPQLCAVVIAGMIPSMALEALHAFRQFRVDERQGSWWRRFWEDRHHILDSKTLAYLQVFNAAHWFAGRFAKQIGSAMEEYDVVERKSVAGRVACMGLGMGIVVMAAAVLVRSVVGHQISIAAFVFDLGALSLLGASLAEIASLIGQQFGQSLYVSSFQDVLALESRTHYRENGTELLAGHEGLSVELRDVRFGYPQGAGKTRREVIRGVSLTIPAGGKWALVGINGAGKTTLNALLSRMFDPDEGDVLLGGVRVRDLDRTTLRRCIGCLPQHIQHYNLTVEEFISLGRAGEAPDAAQVEWAAKRSGAATFVDLYPKRYKQRLGRNYREAEEPSGGQLQKLALASLLYMRAPFMLLDEPTAAIDPEAARDFWDTLFHETPGQTVLFSTHYLGAVRRADRIVVLDQGRILDQGTHDELMARCMAYRALFDAQARDYRT